MDRDQYLKNMQILFASEFAFYLKAANFHWNVEGSDFYEFHLIFERIYVEVYESIDDFAEELRALQSYTPASLGILNTLSTVVGQDQVPQPIAMAKELLQDSDNLAELFRQGFDLAEQFGDHGFSNFLADRQDAHKKHSWMLRSTLK
jgi:starvation-inducible DNA-binding protein